MAASSHTPPFHNSPQRFSKSHQKATEATQAIVGLMQKGSRTILGTVADTTFHLTQGYVTATTQLGVVQVSGVPLGTVLSGMRVYCRRMGTTATNQHYIFDGYASTISSLGSNGSLLIGSGGPSLSSGCATVTGVTSGLIGPNGYYWHCFFSLPSIPTGTVTLFQFSQTSALGTTLSLQLTAGCILQFVSNDGHGYQSTLPIIPHVLHWVVIQPGYAGAALLVDGISAYTGIIGSGDAPTFAGGTNTYTITLGSQYTGSQCVPIGSWLSKFGYGTSTRLFPVIVPSGTPLPAYDTDLVNANAGGIVTNALYLFEDTPGSATARNSAASGSAGTLAVSTPASISMAGPY
jgi:hypothetical protein